MTEIRVPTLGESVSEATVGKWFKKPGDTVKADEILTELETDKVTLEVNAPCAGVLSEILIKAGETVAPGALLGQISENTGASQVTSAPPLKAQTESPRSAGSTEKAAAPMPPSPSAAKIATERKIDPADIKGSGKRGQVLKSDVLDYATGVNGPSPIPNTAPQRPAAQQEDAPREERVKMTRLRQTIARRLKDAQNNAAMLTTFNEIDMSALLALRARYKETFEKKHGVKLGFMGFFVKACCQVLEEIPAINAEIDGQDIIYKNFCHIGVAVGTDKGLVVPVIRNAQDLSIAGIERQIAMFGQKARDGALDIADLQGGTFTISNGGVYGSLMSTPILNAPQSGILGMHKIQDRPIALNGEIVIRPMMYLALSYDHRLVDGKEAVTFVVRLKEMLEDPARLALET
ncbi:dihydrolipoyllysine-residue succinyltransferase component of 2-oxoglutarate dehydrogenase complex [Methylocystaceae bacterium]|nr:dihydrolipoyllysine-residue succinyltransferase component of 2-oxoglutarate dehydrogenase complex [Methylocystaceae bacterium]